MMELVIGNCYDMYVLRASVYLYVGMMSQSRIEIKISATCIGGLLFYAFIWWVPYTLRKRDIILSAVNKRIRKTTHKYGI